MSVFLLFTQSLNFNMDKTTGKRGQIMSVLAKCKTSTKKSWQ